LRQLVNGRRKIQSACQSDFGDHGREVVIASDSEAIQTKPQMRSPSLDCFALLAMTDRARLFSDRPLMPYLL
jgi:hypothetical protein